MQKGDRQKASTRASATLSHTGASGINLVADGTFCRRRGSLAVPEHLYSSRFRWCQENDVQLVDEFDQISHDIEKYWAVDPKQLQQLQVEVEKTGASFTIGKTSADGKIEVVASNMTGGLAESRAQKQVAVLGHVAQHIPPFRATWTVDDGTNNSCHAFKQPLITMPAGPRTFVSWEMREAGRKSIQAGTCSWRSYASRAAAHY